MNHRQLIGAVILCGGSLGAQTPRKMDYPLINSKIVTVQGKIRKGTSMPLIPAGPKAGSRLNDSCTISFSLKPGERAIEARQISPVRTTATGCELEMEVGRPPEDKIEPIHPPTPPRAAIQQAPPSFLAQLRDSILAWFSIPVVHAQSITTSAGYATGYVTDPVGIWTSSEQANLNWAWGGPNCATLVQIWRTVPASFAGWNNTYHILSYPIDACDLYNNYTGGELWSNWENYVFPYCGQPYYFGSVDATYQPLSVSGTGLGVLNGEFSWQITGPLICVSLLNGNFQLVRTWN
jgi:hypothetical protein